MAHLRCGGVVSDDFISNLLLSLSANEFLKSVNIWRSYGKVIVATFFDSQCLLLSAATNKKLPVFLVFSRIVRIHGR